MTACDGQRTTSGVLSFRLFYFSVDLALIVVCCCEGQFSQIPGILQSLSPVLPPGDCDK